ncbi:hypothetical protein RCL_jg24009.t1 [Rhizophagus clarus]|uniref:Uncharacterized protein n=1 Tax=Rhizophagus clarus TaxID=94130 RepID=A0A8H3QRB3_9GLOM|nr:hypothetical protein RCL_jg24009.t1 [Rhizophagus clarus]
MNQTLKLRLLNEYYEPDFEIEASCQTNTANWTLELKLSDYLDKPELRILLRRIWTWNIARLLVFGY